MMTYPHKIIACRALAPALEQFLGTDEPIHVLEIALHLQPDRLRLALLDKVRELEQESTTIVLGYGLCGMALEGVVSSKSTLVVPKVDDCVGMLLGSRARHRKVMNEHPGSYFLEPNWLETELNIFTQMHKGLAHISKERRKQLLKVALKNYDRLVLLAGDDPEVAASEQCSELAMEYDMGFQRMETDLDLIKRLLFGPWNEPEFIVATPGTSIPLFL
ncbi:MAG: DUF1638 domain-containing protein [Proteobacteria bacterium]|nr:DUF1638 domain-containing protein [Pseudomonadota bacterium]